MRHRNLVYIVLFVVIAAGTASAQTKWPTNGWPTSTPQAVGLDAKLLDELDAELKSGKYGYVDNMLVIRNGMLAYERSYKHDYDRIYAEEARKPGPLNAHDPGGPYNYFNPWWHPFYRRGDLHSMQSVTKTITSVVIGAAIARKEFPDIETPVMKFFDAATTANVDDRKKRMTIRHLLSMTAGFDWDENLPYTDPNNSASLMEASADWVKFTIDRPMKEEPGRVFNYNSGATELLAFIFRAATGKDIEEYAAQHLFGPLGIKDYFWKRIPSGLADTEGGLYLKASDLAKIAYLFLKGGVWEGKQIVEKKWVEASVAPSVAVGATVKYGLKWWLFPYGDGSNRMAWAGSGFGGQMPIVLADYDLVIVFTGWNVLPDKPRFSHRLAIDRVREAIVSK